MPMYSIKCKGCGSKQEVFRSMTDCESISSIRCGICNCYMTRDMQADLFHAASDRYDKPIISDSLAIGMDQIAEHKAQFPDIGVTNEGQLVFDKYSTHQAYLKKTGHIKHPGKIRRSAKKVATATATE